MKVNKCLIAYSLASPLHFANFMAYFEENNSNYDRFIVFIDFYWDRNIIPERYITYGRSRGIEIHFNFSFKVKILEEIEVSDYVFLGKFPINFVFKEILKKKIDKIILIDEGVSSYSKYSHLNRAMKREKNKKISFIKYFSKEIIYFLFYFLFKKKVVDFSAFNRDINFNQEYKNGFLNFIKNVGHDLQVDHGDSVLYCSQPYVELGLYDENEYIEKLKKIKIYFETRSCNFIVKKHPVEKIVNYEAVGFTELDFDGMIEEYVGHANVKAIVSNNSTSSILVPALYGLESYILEWNDVEEIGPFALSIFKKYCTSIDNL